MLQIPDLVIAVDGFSSCGKSTLAKQLAHALNYKYIDTGAMYRAVTLFTLENNCYEGDAFDSEKLVSMLNQVKISFIKDAQGKNTVWLNGQNVEDEIRTLRVSNKVSEVSKVEAVRHFLVAQQQAMGTEKRIVMDGRDIGTVVFPKADIKFFMTASVDVRAQRRFDEMIAKGKSVSLAEIAENIRQRDHLDTTRKISPLRQADDAILLDNSNMTRQEQLEWVLEKIRRKFAGR